MREMDRPAAVAGSWYPGSAPTLRAELQRYLDAAGGELARGELLALVAPHAGLVYSGPVAAHAYRLLQDRRYDVAVLVGPSHFVGFRGVAVWPGGAFETPLGPMAVDAAIAASLMAHSPDIREHPAAHAREHSLEMQLPFLKLLMPDTPIVPLVMGYQTRETAEGLGRALADTLAGRRALLVASSDLSHYHDAPTAAGLDRVVIDCVEAFPAASLMDALERQPEHACGGGPMVSVLHAARALGATGARVLRYADSGDVSGDKDAVVGYMAAAIGRFE